MATHETTTAEGRRDSQMSSRSELFLQARKNLLATIPHDITSVTRSPDAAEGGCGVLGLASRTPIAGKHVLSASRQMHNRGNGKGGGIAMAGLDPSQIRVSAEVLQSHYLLQIALLDASALRVVEKEFIAPWFDIAQAYEIDRLDDYRSVAGLDVRPPDVRRYFVRVKPDVLDAFITENGLSELPQRASEDEFVYQNSFKLNAALYASLGEKQAFVLSHGRDLLTLKIVGYAEQVVEYYELQEQTARVWIAHQRYPTKGRVWHPGGAHPFIGMNEALVHNGDFANYHAVGEYLQQRNMQPLFLTDTEVAALQFDLFDRVYEYPLEITLEALAPTTEHDFVMLPDAKKALYRAVQATHTHGSPDGPWFFILARSQPDTKRSELLGITDTSMLRPQVFALYENDLASDPVQIGLIASERQAINACLRSLAQEDKRFQPLADKYWVARGGSHTDGGSFRFTVTPDSGLTCTNKFGEVVHTAQEKSKFDQNTLNPDEVSPTFREVWRDRMHHSFDDGGSSPFSSWIVVNAPKMSWDELAWVLRQIREFASYGDDEWVFSWETLTKLRDQQGKTGNKKQSSVKTLIDQNLDTLFDESPNFTTSENSRLSTICRITRDSREELRAPGQKVHLVIDTARFPPEGELSAARLISQAASLGWRHIIAYNWRGGRFAGSGLGPNSHGLRLDLYGDVGDYAASGLDGAEVHIHADGQDQVGQILRQGKLVIHGDVGQTFLYGAKGGEIYVRGSAAGRPLINAVGKPRAVINGTCLDYLAESFMAGDPLNDGGFVILNGVKFDETEELVPLESPYPGGNLFSLASGGAIYLRDPHKLVTREQLNGGEFSSLTIEDWELIKPYLEENEQLFGIRISDLLTVNGTAMPPEAVYRKVAIKEASRLLLETDNR